MLPLPESMIPYIWDYKSLEPTEEKKYIHKMIEKTYESAKILGKSILLVNLWLYKQDAERQKVMMLGKEIDTMGMVVQNCQLYIKKEEDSPWAVSLRDVSRFCKLFVYFHKNNVMVDGSNNIKKEDSYNARDIALVLGVYFCYVIRISVFSERVRFVTYLH